MKELRYLNKFFLQYKWHFLLGILFVSLSNYFRVLQPRLIRQALDLVFENIGIYALYEGFELQQNLNGILAEVLLLFGVLVLILALIMGIFMYFMRQTIIVMSRLIEYDIRKELFDHYQNLTVAFYKRNKTGDLMSRITEDVNKVRMYLGPAILYGINLVSLFILVIISMLQVSQTLTFYALLPLPLLSLSIYYVSSLIHKRSEIIQIQLAKLNSIAQEVYSGIRVVKSYVQEPFMSNYFSEQSEDYKEKALNLARVDAFFFPLMVLLVGASTLIVVYVGGILVARGTITPGNIAEFVIYVGMLTWPVTAIGWIASIIQQAEASQKRINQFLKTNPDISNSIEESVEIDGKIEFKDVTFVYPDTGIKALDQVSFTLEPGQRMALIGRTGSGKTTVADLLVRMYDITEGSIQIDGKDIREHDLNNLRKRIGYIPQDVFLFSDTISGNIAFGRRSATEEEVRQYAQYAAVHQDIMELPENYNTMVGERGVMLSGGQKQRISIARAFVKQPDIVVFDDSLSAVDTSTEQQILNYLDTSLVGKTAIIITHRIYALLQFDKIIVLDQGKIIEQGTHEELLQNGGYYAELVERQQVEEQ